MEKKRCDWVDLKSQIYIDYHDNVWGREVHDDIKLFEMLSLEAMQAGLSWITILKKQENYQKAFDNFDFIKIANYDEQKFDQLMLNAGIIRNKLKIKAIIKNAKVYISIIEEFGSFDKYLWGHIDYKPIDNNLKSQKEMPAQSDLSVQISKDLKKRGMSFVGPVVIYAYMQSIGMVNDHQKDCFCRENKLMS